MCFSFLLGYNLIRSLAYSSHLPITRSVISEQLLVIRQEVAVVWRRVYNPGASVPGGATTACQFTGSLDVFVCVCHRRKRALRAAVPVLPRGCLLTVPFTSQHGPGHWI